MKLKTIAFLLGVSMLGTVLQTARASTLNASDYSTSVLYSGTQLVQGDQAYTTTLQVPRAGEVFLSLMDLDFPVAFDSLQFTLTDLTKSASPISQPGTLTLDVSGPTTLYAEVFADARGGAAGLGLYNLTASLLTRADPVPLPASGGLLAAVTLLAGLLELTFRRRARAVVTTAMA